MNLQTSLEEQDIAIQHFEDLADQVTGAGYSVEKSVRSTYQWAPPSCTWFPGALRQFRAIEALRAGWDSQGGDPPDREAIRSGAALLRALAIANPNLAKPHIHPTRSGGLQFHWESGARYFEIEILDSLTAQFYYVDNNSHVEIEGRLRVGDSLANAMRLLHMVEQG